MGVAPVRYGACGLSMLQTGGVSEPEVWVSVDTAAATPGSVRSADPVAAVTARRRVRIRRSRQPVIGALDGGGAIFQRRLRDVLIGSTVLAAPAIGVNLWTTVVAFERFDPDEQLIPDAAGAGQGDLAAWLSIVLVGAVTALVGHFVAQILLGERFGTPVTLRRALVHTLRRSWAVLVAWLIGHCWVPLFAFAVVGAENDDLGGLIFLHGLISWFTTTVMLFVVPAMVGERLGPFAAVKRSWRLTRRRFGHCFWFVLLATFLAGAVLLGFASLAPLLEATEFIGFGGAVWLVQGILLQVAVLLVVPLIALGTAQLYVEVRLDAEGLDLMIDADAAFGPARTGTA